MIKNCYKIEDYFKLNEIGVNDKGGIKKLLTKGQYHKAIKKLKRKGFIYIAWRDCWVKENEIVYFTDYIEEDF